MHRSPLDPMCRYDKWGTSSLRRARSVEDLLHRVPPPMAGSFLSAWEREPAARKVAAREGRKLPRLGADTLRSVRSVQSVKSVTIAPKVTEFHYTGRYKKDPLCKNFSTFPVCFRPSGHVFGRSRVHESGVAD